MKYYICASGYLFLVLLAQSVIVVTRICWCVLVVVVVGFWLDRYVVGRMDGG